MESAVQMKYLLSPKQNNDKIPRGEQEHYYIACDRSLSKNNENEITARNSSNQYEMFWAGG